MPIPKPDLKTTIFTSTKLILGCTFRDWITRVVFPSQHVSFAHATANGTHSQLLPLYSYSTCSGTRLFKSIVECPPVRGFRVGGDRYTQIYRRTSRSQRVRDKGPISLFARWNIRSKYRHGYADENKTKKKKKREKKKPSYTYARHIIYSGRSTDTRLIANSSDLLVIYQPFKFTRTRNTTVYCNAYYYTVYQL